MAYIHFPESQHGYLERDLTGCWNNLFNTDLLLKSNEYIEVTSPQISVVPPWFSSLLVMKPLQAITWWLTYDTSRRQSDTPRFQEKLFTFVFTENCQGDFSQS